jgi:hypothetical protein
MGDRRNSIVTEFAAGGVPAVLEACVKNHSRR